MIYIWTGVQLHIYIYIITAALHILNPSSVDYKYASSMGCSPDISTAIYIWTGV